MEQSPPDHAISTSPENDRLLTSADAGKETLEKNRFRSITAKQVDSPVALTISAPVSWMLPGPVFGGFALFVAICCMSFSLAILIASNEKPIVSWPTQPTVYLAVAAAISNTAVAIAYAQASAIAWWYQASKGASIRKLERQWEASFSMEQAILHYRDSLSLAMVAGLLVAAMVADGPMLQRASSVIVATQSKAVSLSFLLAPKIPTAFSGIMLSQLLFMTHGALKVTEDWEAQNPIVIPVTPTCAGSCSSKVMGPGFARTNCSTVSWPISDQMYHDPTAIWGRSNDSSTNLNFFISLSSKTQGESSDMSGDSEGANLRYGSIDLDISRSVNRYIETSCHWTPAIIEYDVTFMDDNHTSISSNPDANIDVLQLVNNTQAWNPSNTVGIQNVTHDWLISYLSAFVNAIDYSVPPHEDAPAGSFPSHWAVNFQSMSSQFLKYVDYSTLDKDMDDINGDMYLSFRDPTSDIIQSLNEMVFRAAVMTSTWSNLTQLIDDGLSPHQTTQCNPNNHAECLSLGLQMVLWGDRT